MRHYHALHGQTGGPSHGIAYTLVDIKVNNKLPNSTIVMGATDIAEIGAMGYPITIYRPCADPDNHGDNYSFHMAR